MIAMLHFIAMYAYCKVFGHFTAFYCFYTYIFQCITEIYQWLVIIQLATESKAPCPCKDGCDRVGRCRVAFLVLAIVTGNRTVCSLSLHGIAIRGDQYRGHQAQRTETLCY